jgi:4-diphosphocytidyl-2-C-methyl-D-erythritol kinase
MSELAKRQERLQYQFTKHFACADGPLFLILSDVDRWPGNLQPRLLASNGETEVTVAFRDNSRAMIRFAKLAGGVNRVTVEHEASANDSSRDGSTGNASAAGFDYEIFWFELFEMLNARLMPGKVSIATAPGKVNLFFKVGPLLESGYHDVASLYLAVDLRENVTAQIATEYSVQVTGSLGDFQLLSVPTDETNLVVKVAEQVKAAAGTPSAIKLVLGIDKHVPVAGGMGGGSADAAAALVAVNDLLGANLSAEALHNLAAELGSDVPFALAGGAAIGVGRGEQLTALENVAPIHLVLILDDQGLSTPAVYRRLDELRAARNENAANPEMNTDLLRALQRSNAFELAELMHNDLEEAALSLRPDLKIKITTALQHGALRAMVSGSGPTILALAASEAAAMQIARAMNDLGYNAIATHGPAAATERVD